MCANLPCPPFDAICSPRKSSERGLQHEGCCDVGPSDAWQPCVTPTKWELLCHDTSGWIIIFHQPEIRWFGGYSPHKPPFGVNSVVWGRYDSPRMENTHEGNHSLRGFESVPLCQKPFHMATSCQRKTSQNLAKPRPPKEPRRLWPLSALRRGSAGCNQLLAPGFDKSRDSPSENDSHVCSLSKVFLGMQSWFPILALNWDANGHPYTCKESITIPSQLLPAAAFQELITCQHRSPVQQPANEPHILVSSLYPPQKNVEHSPSPCDVVTYHSRGTTQPWRRRRSESPGWLRSGRRQGRQWHQREDFFLRLPQTNVEVHTVERLLSSWKRSLCTYFHVSWWEVVLKETKRSAILGAPQFWHIPVRKLAFGPKEVSCCLAHSLSLFVGREMLIFNSKWKEVEGQWLTRFNEKDFYNRIPKAWESAFTNEVAKIAHMRVAHNHNVLHCLFSALVKGLRSGCCSVVFQDVRCLIRV